MTDRPDMAEWTDEQRNNAMTYGICRQCGKPYASYTTTETDDDGRQTITRGIDCPNHHMHP